jgi:hypothetical protein
MKKVKLLIAIPLTALCIAALISGCTLFGLKKQTDYSRITNVDTTDAHLYKTAWDYLKSRAYGSKTDTIFRRMYDGIIYSGIDTNEYIKPGRTFIFMTNTAVTASLWAKYKVGGVVGTKWQSYSKTDVKNYLSYLILLNQYSHYNLPLLNVFANTLAPAGAYTTNPTTFLAPIPSGGTYNSNPKSQMLLRVSNANTVTSQLDYPIVLNDTNNVNTSDLLATNGVVFVLSNSAVAFFYPVQ